MQKIIPLALLSSVLVACGGSDNEKQESSSSSNSPTPSSSAPSNPVSSSSSSSSSSPMAPVPMPPASSSSVAPTPMPPASSSSAPGTPEFNGDAVSGKMLFQDENGDCAFCHTDNNDGTFTNNLGGGTYNVNEFLYPTKTDFTAETPADLAAFIAAQMPPPSGGFDPQKSRDVAAYLWSLKGSDVVVAPQGCSSSDPVFYGQRALKLLTSFEYHNSLQSLFSQPLPADYSTQNKANADKVVANLPNHAKEPVTEGRMNAYDANAEELAAWAVSTMGALPFTCTEVAACTNSFLSEFAYPAFRRPLTAEEKADYGAIISGPEDLTKGLQWAIRAVLMSPQFLYRSELGIPVSQAREEGWGVDAGEVPSGGNGGGGSAADGYEAAPGGTTVNGVAFTMKGDGSDNMDGTFNLYTTGGISQSFTFSADPSLLVVSVKANDYNGEWPIMNVTVNGQMVAMATVDHYELVEYKYLITGQSGAAQVGISFVNEDAGEGPPWGVKGLDKNLYVGDVTVSAAQMAGASTPTPEPEPVPQGSPLELADANAYVLDPYEYASALAYMFTATGPDKTLLDAAAAGELSNPANVEAQIDRLMETERGKEQVGRFAGLWLRTDGVVAANRDKEEFTDEVKKSMAQEVREMFKHVFYNEDVPYSEFVGGDFTLLDKTLSDFYGIPGGGSAHMQFAMVPTTERGGILTTGAFMAVNAHMDRTAPIKRSTHMREDLLCQIIPPPPSSGLGADRTVNQAKVDAKQATGELTTAEFYQIQTEHPACDSCHLHIINPAFGMDDFDNIGLPRKKLTDGTVVQAFGLGENGKADVPIEWIQKGMLNGANSLADAEADGVNGTGIPFKGAKDLSKKLADVPSINSCLVEKAFRYTAGYALKVSAQVDEEKAKAPLSDEQKAQYACVASELETALTQTGSPKAMFKALGMSEVVRFRR